MRSAFRLWLFGLGLGVVTPLVLVWPTLGFVVVVALLIVLVLQRPRTAGPGGFLLAFAVWWAGLEFEAAQRCAALNAQPNAGCEIFFSPTDLVLPVVVLLAGLMFTALTFFPGTPKRGRAGDEAT